MVYGIPANCLRVHHVPWQGIRGRFLLGVFVVFGVEGAGGGEGSVSLCLLIWAALYVLRTLCIRSWSFSAFAWSCVSSLWYSCVQNLDSSVVFVVGRELRMVSCMADFDWIDFI